MEKNRILVVGLIGLLMAAGLALMGCSGMKNCLGNGECTVTIDQGTSGLYVDNNAPRSSCGTSASWNSDYTNKVGGCKVQNNMDNFKRTFGTHSCDCAG